MLYNVNKKNTQYSGIISQYSGIISQYFRFNKAAFYTFSINLTLVTQSFTTMPFFSLCKYEVLKRTLIIEMGLNLIGIGTTIPPNTISESSK